MLLVVTIVHVLACVILVLVVLLQAGKGADMGAVFGGASSTIFGSSGAGNFLTRLTTGAAIVFMATSLTLTYGSVRATTSTIMPESVAPAVPEAPLAGDVEGGTEGGNAPDVAGGTQPEAAADAAPAGEGAGQPAGEGAAPAAPPAAEPPAAPEKAAPPVAP